MSDLEPLLIKLIERPARINSIAGGVGVSDTTTGLLFQEVTVGVPKLTGNNEGLELAFLQTVSWLYVLYKESGRDRLEFVLTKGALYGLNTDSWCEKHIRFVDRLRTYFQHNLNRSRKDDRATEELVQKWLKGQCDGSLPTGDELWLRCVMGLVVDAEHCLETVESVLSSIETDEFRDVILEDWAQKSKNLQAHEFDPLIQEIAAEIGRDDLMELDIAVSVRKKYAGDWTQSLKHVMKNKDQKEEAKKYIYATLVTLAQRHPLLPGEIAARFGIPAGDTRLAKLGRIALDIWVANPCSPEELLDKLTPFAQRER